jgi:phosphoglycerate dehydrogenase-like enzyme
MRAVLYTFRRNDPVLRFVEAFPELEWSVVWSPVEAAGALGRADVVVLSNRICTPELGDVLRRHRSPSLGWIHFLSAGIERGLAMGLPAGVPVSNSGGAKAGVIAEHAMTLLPAIARRLPDMRRAQSAHRWARLEINPLMRSLEGATVCIVGLGGVGRELARKLKAFDARVVAVSRTGNDPNVDRLFSRARMNEALAEADAVVVCTNADESSLRMLGTAQFAAMKAGAYLVNVARGEILDEAALAAALEAGRLAGAGLDVLETEPPATGNPLWDMENVILSPHVAGGGATGYARQKEIFAENLRRFRTGERLFTSHQPSR